MNILENKTSYQPKELIGFAQRENNSKRNYLIVNNIQAKHVPVSPHKALELFKQLGKDVYTKYGNENVLVIGFAETATAIGAAVAGCFKQRGYYIHTTREEINEKYSVVNFREEHSHAVQQALYCLNIKKELDNADRILFVEDEITTGNTILNFVEVLENKLYLNDSIKLGVASIINSMGYENKIKFEQKGIDCTYLIKLNSNFDKLVFENKQTVHSSFNHFKNEIEYINIKGRVEPRTGIACETYFTACKELSKEVLTLLKYEKNECKDILILGTEEFMYPAIICGESIEHKYKNSNVSVHATSRSPIVPDMSTGYPLKNRFELESYYELGRKTYIYNIQKYDKVFIISDSKFDNKSGSHSLVAALNEYGNTDITEIRWVE